MVYPRSKEGVWCEVLERNTEGMTLNEEQSCFLRER